MLGCSCDIRGVLFLCIESEDSFGPTGVLIVHLVAGGVSGYHYRMGISKMIAKAKFRPNSARSPNSSHLEGDSDLVCNSIFQL